MVTGITALCIFYPIAFWRDALAPSARLAKNPTDYAVDEDFFRSL